MEVYIDDIVVNSKKVEDHTTNLEETFGVPRQNNMKLNPTKCSFGVASGKFLGYMVTERGIEASLEQVKAIIKLQAPRSVKEVQRLTII